MSDIEVIDRADIVRREVDRESSERALAVMDPAILDTMFASRDPKMIVQRIADVSEVLMDAVHQRDLARRYGDNENEFLHIEAWQFLSSMLGMTVVGVSSRPLPDGSGWEATAELRHVASGRVLGARDGMCQKTEPTYARRRGGPPPENTIRQMAQIRAARAAARSVLGFVPKIGGFEISDPEAPLTNDQLGTLHSLERKLGLTHEQGHAEAGTDSYKNLTREQASEVIDRWQTSVAAGVNGGAPTAPDEGPGEPSRQRSSYGEGDGGPKGTPGPQSSSSADEAVIRPTEDAEPESPAGDSERSSSLRTEHPAGDTTLSDDPTLDEPAPTAQWERATRHGLKGNAALKQANIRFRKKDPLFPELVKSYTELTKRQLSALIEEALG